MFGILLFEIFVYPRPPLLPLIIQCQISLLLVEQLRPLLISLLLLPISQFDLSQLVIDTVSPMYLRLLSLLVLSMQDSLQMVLFTGHLHLLLPLK